MGASRAPSTSSLDSAEDAEQEIKSFLDSGAPTVTLSSRLDVAIDALGASRRGFLPVLDDDRHVRGALAIADFVRVYRARPPSE